MNDYAYELLFGAIINRAIRDYQEYTLSKDKSKYVANIKRANYTKAKHWIFSPPSAGGNRNLEGLLTDYGYNNIEYIRKLANSNTLIQERN